MANYEVDGIQYEIDDSLDLNQTVQQIRLSKDHFEASTKATTQGLGSSIGENVRGGLTAAGDFMGMLPGMIGAAAPAAIEGITKGPEAGLKLGGEIIEQMNPLSQKFMGGHPLPGTEALEPDRQTGAYQNLMKPFELMNEGAGLAVKGLAGEIAGQVGGRELGQELEEDYGPQLEASGQLGLMVGFGGAMGRGMVRAGKAREAQRAEVQKAQEILDKATEAEATLAKTEAEQKAYTEGYEQLDSTMLRYPKDYQAPQLGMGGKLARVPDQAKAERPKADQQKFDEDMAHIAEAESLRAFKDKEQARSVQNRPMPPAMEPRKPHMVGPEATSREVYSDPAAVAEAVRRKMDEARQETQRVVPDQPVGAAPRSSPGFNPRLHELQTGLKWNNQRGYFEEIPTTARGQLEAIRDASEVPYYKELARMLLADKEFSPKVEIKSLAEVQAATGERSLAAYDPHKHSILMPLEALGKEALTLHEFVHAGTYGAIEGVRAGRPIAKHLTRPVERLQGLYNTFRDIQMQGEKVLPYGLKSIHEFIAEGFTNPEFQALLARTKLPTHMRKGALRTYWDKFVEVIGNLLGFDRNKHNYLSELIRVGADIIQGSGSEVRRLYDKSPDQLAPGAFELKDFKQQLKDQGVKIPEEAVKALWEARKRPSAEPKAHATEGAAVAGAEIFQRQYADRRPLEEVAKELVNVKKDTLADQASYNTIGKLIQGRFIAQGNPLLSWISSQLHWIKQEATQASNNIMHGSSRKRPDPGTANYLWKDFKKEEKIAVNTINQALQMEQTWLGEAGIQTKAKELLGRELSRKEMQAYLDRLKGQKKMLADVNKAFIEEGKEPIAELPHYASASTFEGPFKVKFLDKEGNTVKMEGGFYLRPNEAKFKKNFPEYKIEIVEEGLKGDIDFQQFEQVLRQLSKEQRDPAAKAISEGLRRMGFRKHGLKRKGVKGALGTEGGVKGVRNYEEVYERGIRSAYDFLANRQLDKIHEQVRTLKEADHLPYTKTWALEAIDAARGGSNKALDAISREVSAAIRGTITVGSGGKLNLPLRFTRDLLRQSNKAITTLLLGFFNPIHIGAQMIQAPSFMPPKLLSMAQQAGINPARIMNVMAKSLGEYSKWSGSKDAIALEKVGAFDATFKYDWSTYAGDSSPHYKRTMTEHASGLSTLMWIESHTVRRPAAHMFLEMLREVGYDKIAKDKTEIYKVAREMTDHYMVSMRFYEKPHIFSRTGLIGMAMSPLKSFATTWLGMLREYTKLSAQGLLDVPKGKMGSAVGKQLPLTAFLATSLMTAGMMGVIGIKEWDVLAKLANNLWGYNIPTGTEWVASKFKTPGVRYGLLSEALPYNLSVGPTFASPSLAEQQFWTPPGLGFLGNVAGAAITGAKELGADVGLLSESSRPGATEKREALKGITPRFPAWGIVEEMFTPKGQPYAEAGGQAGPYTRTEEDWKARRLGGYTTQERDEKTKFYTAKQRARTITKQVDRAVDIILSGKDQDKLPLLWQEVQEKGFTSQEVLSALKREVYGRLVEADVRALGKGMTPKQQRLWMLYQQLQGDQQGAQ
jgi:hypothetical protein